MMPTDNNIQNYEKYDNQNIKKMPNIILLLLYV